MQALNDSFEHYLKIFSAELIENIQPHITFFVDGTMPSLMTAIKHHSSAATDEVVTTDM